MRVRLVVCVPVVVHHQRLVPYCVAAVGVVVPVASARICHDDRVAPAELKDEMQHLFEVSREAIGY